MFINQLNKFSKEIIKIYNGHKRRHMMCVLYKDIADMDLTGKTTIFNLNITLKRQIHKFILPMEFLIHILKWKTL